MTAQLDAQQNSIGYQFNKRIEFKIITLVHNCYIDQHSTWWIYSLGRYQEEEDQAQTGLVSQKFHQQLEKLLQLEPSVYLDQNFGTSFQIAFSKQTQMSWMSSKLCCSSCKAHQIKPSVFLVHYVNVQSLITYLYFHVGLDWQLQRISISQNLD